MFATGQGTLCKENFVYNSLTINVACPTFTCDNVICLGVLIRITNINLSLRTIDVEFTIKTPIAS